MDYTFKYILILIVFILDFLSTTCADSYNVKIGTEHHINLVDSKFLSFTIDPKYLFSSSEKYNTKECICMAASLTPAYIRIAGPSTSHMTFRNTSIAIDDLDTTEPKKRRLSKLFRDDSTASNQRKLSLSVTHGQWEKFVQWAKKTGFDLVFALNSDEKTASGMWDPNNALKILTVADKADIGDMFWQLGYECTNQSIEEYLNDMETLRVIIETFAPGRAGRWKVVGGDVTHCLQADSKSDFKDYVTLSNDMMDAILLNGNSSSQELERMSEKDRLKLLKLLSHSSTPLWLTEHSPQFSELERAADWMTSLGFSARNGFSIHYRELMEKELYEPTLSFYMALLFKNLVGERVLSVDLDPLNTALFAHCTSLRRRPAPGALTLYAANVGEEPARFSIKLPKREDGGDIMQFILENDHSGNIVVNGRAMYYEGDIRPVVKRVRPYKTLLLNLPPKSFGFWVLANTQVEACSNYEENKNKHKDSIEITRSMGDNKDEIINFIKKKRSLNTIIEEDNLRLDLSDAFIEGMEDNEIGKENAALKERIDAINNDLKSVHKIFKTNLNKDLASQRVRRQTYDEDSEAQNTKSRRYSVKSQLSKIRNLDPETLRNNLFNKLSKISKENIMKLKNIKGKRFRGMKRSYRTKSKRNSKDSLVGQTNVKVHKSIKGRMVESKEIVPSLKDLNEKEVVSENKVRQRRNVNAKKSKTKHEEESSENEITSDSKETFKLGKILHKLKKISEMPIEIQNKDDHDYEENEDYSEGLVLKTKLLDDSAVINISEKSHSGLLKSTMQDILSLMADFNKNLNRIWSALTILEY